MGGHGRVRLTGHSQVVRQPGLGGKCGREGDKERLRPMEEQRGRVGGAEGARAVGLSAGPWEQGRPLGEPSRGRFRHVQRADLLLFQVSF